MGGTHFYLPSRQCFVFILRHTCICYYLPCLEEAYVKFCSNSHPCELYSFTYQTGALRLEHGKAESVKGRVVDEHISLKTRFFLHVSEAFFSSRWLSWCCCLFQGAPTSQAGAACSFPWGSLHLALI